MKSFVFHPASGSRMRYLEFLLPGTANDTTTTSPPPPPLLMLHGLGCASSFEYPHVALAPALRHHQHQRRIVLLDLPGYGYSDRPADFGYGVPDLAAAVVTFVEARLLLPPAPEDPAGVGVHGVLDIYGHSMGGSVAVEVADRLGAAARVRVRALVLSEANLDAGGGTFSRVIAAFPGGEDAYVARGHAADLERYAAAGEDLENVLAMSRAACPRAVFRGSVSLVQGGGEPSWRARFLAHPSRRKAYIFGFRSLPDPDVEVLRAAGIEVPILEGAGHDMSRDNPEGLAEIIARVTSVEGG